MARKPKPHVHGRDHEHGGADTTLIHYEDVGTSGAGGGIQFDSYPQDGQWLYLETDGPDTSPSGYGVEVFDASGNGVDLASAGGQVTIQTTGAGDILLQATGDIVLRLSGSSSHIRMPDLPTSDPGIPNVLWVDSSGFLRRSF